MNLLEIPAPGDAVRCIYPSIKSLPARLYRPKRLKDDTQVIVAVHGISRQYDDQLEAFRTLADKFGCWLVVPEFEKGAFPQYQKLSKGPYMPRADIALNTLLIAFRKHVGLPEFKIKLCGYSGGAQFAHRYALFHPNKIASLVICSAGWYTIPNREDAYPYGLKEIPSWMGKAQIDSMLNIPLMVAVGERDTVRDKSLRTGARVDKAQGMNRLERAHTWFKELAELKGQLLGVTSPRLCVLPEQGHDFAGSFFASGLKTCIDQFWSECNRR